MVIFLNDPKFIDIPPFRSVCVWGGVSLYFPLDSRQAQDYFEQWLWQKWCFVTCKARSIKGHAPSTCLSQNAHSSETPSWDASSQNQLPCCEKPKPQGECRSMQRCSNQQCQLSPAFGSPQPRCQTDEVKKPSDSCGSIQELLATCGYFNLHLIQIK